MKIAVWVEPKMAISNWYHELESGLIAGLSSKHLKASFDSLDAPDPSVDRETTVILAGETYEWYNRMLSFANERQLVSCVVGCEHPMHSSITVSSDYQQVAYNMIQYLYDVGKRKIALFGANPSSPHDNLRLEAYRHAVVDLGLSCDDRDIYFTTGYINQCVLNFQDNIAKYDAVMGTNDLYAFFALIAARRIGLRVPEDLYIAGFGNTTLATISKPPITSATVNLYNIGFQAISAIQLLRNNDTLIGISIKSNDVYYARESTECRPFSEKYIHKPNIPSAASAAIERAAPVTSFGDDRFMSIVNYEDLLRHIDQVDYSIIQCIINKKCAHRSMLIDDCYLSDTALDYRLKKLYRRFIVKSYGELYKKIMEMSEYIDISKVNIAK